MGDEAVPSSMRGVRVFFDYHRRTVEKEGEDRSFTPAQVIYATPVMTGGDSVAAAHAVTDSIIPV